MEVADGLLWLSRVAKPVLPLQDPNHSKDHWTIRRRREFVRTCPNSQVRDREDRLS